ncbi:hypothetical protein WA026_021097 [Henosepilachna vigintioctopunctata]|uniref:Uncharacterized protein n=1 Tax=Henosepilachna vigintioctopunctata TaxID=420089 RepID=A0AAW1UUU1_9CUCU
MKVKDKPSEISDEEEDADSYKRIGKRNIRRPVWMNEYDMSEGDMCFFTNEEELISMEDVLRENNTWIEVTWPENNNNKFLK